MKKENAEIKGLIHSFESFGTLDGPGIRFVLFMAGCPLKCKYCHNIDVVYCKKKDAQIFTPQEIIEKILKNKPYFEKKGGVTVSGGDPVLQIDFVAELFKLCRKNKIHTAFDSSLYTSQKNLDKIIDLTDLFLISLKHFNPKVHQFLTGVENDLILKNIKYLSDKKQAIWYRFLVLPGYTDTQDNLESLVEFCKKTNYEKVELLAYHKMGVEKWKKLGFDYELDEVNLPTEKKMKEVENYLKERGVELVRNE